MMKRILDEDTLKQLIESTIKKGTDLEHSFSENSVQELIHKLSVYHEELLFQNEELARSKAEIEKIEAKFKNLFNNSPLGYVVTDEELKINFFNTSFSELLGLNEKLYNTLLNQYIDPLSQDTFYLFYRDLLKGIEPDYIKISVVNNNEKVPVKVKAQTYIENGKKFFRFIFIDISLEEKITQELKESEEKHRLISENTSDIVVFNADGKITYASPSYIKMFHKNETSLLMTDKNTIYNSIHPDDRDKLFADINKVISEKKDSYIYVYRTLDNKGNYIWREDHAKFIYDKSGKLLKTYVIARDITQRKKDEEELLKLFTAIEQSNTSVVITDLDGNIGYVNPNFEQVTGYSKQEVIGQNPKILKSGYHDDKFYKQMWDKLISGESFKSEFLNKKKNGELYWENCVITPVKNNKGEVISYIAVKADITKQKELEESLRLALEKAEELNIFKDNLLKNISHEVRTPLNGILGFAEELSQTLKDEDQKDMAKFILQSGRRLENMLYQMLDLAELQSSKFNIELTKADITKSIKVNAERFVALAKQKGLIYNIDIPNEKIYAKINEHYFNTALNCLLDNAIKFTQKGAINLKVQLVEEYNKKYVKIYVSDTGIGIAKEDKEKIWLPFKQISEGFGRAYEGTGIGLSLVKIIILQFNGKIELESEVNKGSTFIITLPAEFENEPQINNTKHLQKILCVDDDETNRNLLNLFLKKDFEVALAHSADIALKLIEEQKFDIILTDINLGYGMTGFDLAKHIRTLPNYKSVILIAVTAYDTEDNILKIFEAGFNKYIKKPFLKAELLKVLKNLIN